MSNYTLLNFRIEPFFPQVCFNYVLKYKSVILELYISQNYIVLSFIRIHAIAFQYNKTNSTLLSSNLLNLGKNLKLLYSENPRDIKSKIIQDYIKEYNFISTIFHRY